MKKKDEKDKKPFTFTPVMVTAQVELVDPLGLDENDNLLGNADVIICGCVIVKGFKIMASANGYELVMPKNIDNQKRLFTACFSKDSDYMAQMAYAIAEAYTNAVMGVTEPNPCEL